MILKFGRSPGMAIAVDCIKHQHKQTNKQVMWPLSHSIKVKVLLTNHCNTGTFSSQRPRLKIMVQKLELNVSLSIGPQIHVSFLIYMYVSFILEDRQQSLEM